MTQTSFSSSKVPVNTKLKGSGIGGDPPQHYACAMAPRYGSSYLDPKRRFCLGCNNSNIVSFSLIMKTIQADGWQNGPTVWQIGKTTDKMERQLTTQRGGWQWEKQNKLLG